MTAALLLTDPDLATPFIQPSITAELKLSSSFTSWAQYRRTCAHVYVLEGSAPEVHAQIAPSSDLDAARTALHLHRARSLGEATAIPFLRAAPVLALEAADVAVLEVLHLVRRTELLARRWGYPLPLRMLAWLLREDRRVLLERLQDVLASWELVEVSAAGGEPVVEMPERAVRLFATEGEMYRHPVTVARALMEPRDERTSEPSADSSTHDLPAAGPNPHFDARYEALRQYLEAPTRLN